MISIGLNKQQALEANLKSMQQINFTGNLARDGDANTTMSFIFEEVEITIWDFSEETAKVF